MDTETTSRTRPHVGYLLEEHLEELAFLHVQRRYLLFAVDVPLLGLREHDERIVAHWDGLVEGGPAAVELASQRLTEFDPWDVFASVRVWLELGCPEPVEILEQMASAGPENMAGWREALRRMPATVLDQRLPTTATEELPDEVQASLVYARGWHQTQDLSALPALAESDCSELRRTLARTLGWGLASTETASGLLGKLVEDPDEAVARAAMWSTVLRGDGEAAAHCRELVTAGEADPFQVQLLGLLGQPDDCLIMRPYLEQAEFLPVATRALGNLGSLKSVPWLIDLLPEDLEDEQAEPVVTALETLLGDLPYVEEESVEQWWERLESKLDQAIPVLRGQARPWPLASEDEPMESRWLSCLRKKKAEPDWLRLEIPDGFFTAGDNPEALPGE